MAGNYTAAELKLAQDVLSGLRSDNCALAAQTLTAVYQNDVQASQVSELIDVCKNGFMGMSVDHSMINGQAGFTVLRNEQEKAFVANIENKTPEQLLDFLKSKDPDNRLSAFAAQKYPDLGVTATLSMNPDGSIASATDNSSVIATSTYFDSDSSSSNSGDSAELSEEDIDTRTAIFMYRRANGFQKMLAGGDTETVAKYLSKLSGVKEHANPEIWNSMFEDAESGMALDAFNEKHSTQFDEESYEILRNVRTSGDPTHMLGLFTLVGTEDTDTGIKRYHRFVQEDLHEQLAKGVDKYNPAIKRNADILALINGNESAEEAAAEAENADANGDRAEAETDENPGPEADDEGNDNENSGNEEISLMTIFTNPGLIMDKINFWDGMLDNIGNALSGNSALGAFGGIANMIFGFIKQAFGFVKNLVSGFAGGSSDSSSDQEASASAENDGATTPSAGQDFNPAANQPASNNAPDYGTQQPSAARESLSAQQAVAAADTRVDTTTPAQPQQPAPSETDNTPAPASASAPAPRN